MILRVLFILPGAILASTCAVAADLDSPLNDHFRLTAGLWSVSSSTDVRLDSDSGLVGTPLSGENDLGLRDRSQLADISADLRTGERHDLRFSYFQLNRNASATLDRSIRFGNNVYQINDLVDSQLNVSSIGATYTYAFLRRQRFELGASFGLHVIQFDAEAKVPARDLDEDEAQTGPVPALGLSTTVIFSQRFHAEARAEYLNVHISGIDGKYLDAHAGVFYRFNNNIAVGLGYALLDTEVSSDKATDSGRFKLKNSGGELLLRVGF